MRNSLVFYRSIYEAIKDLPRDVQGEIYTAIMEYGLNGNETDNLKPIARSFFILIKPLIDKNISRYENGKKGGRPKTEPKPNNNQTITKREPDVDVDVDVDVDINNTPPKSPPKGKGVIDKFEEEFERFRKMYPGTKRGLDTEYANFKRKHKDYRDAVFLLYDSAERYKIWREKKIEAKEFAPEYANLQTWINQRRWESEYETVKPEKVNERNYIR